MIWLWLGFFALVALLLVLDRNCAPNNRRSVRWSAVWLALGLSFAGFVYLTYEHAWFGATLVEPSERPGADASIMFVSGYLVEGAVSVDNIFVVAIVFRTYQVPTKSQPYWLWWALVGSMVARVITLSGGAYVVSTFNAVFYLLGGYFLYSGIKLLTSKSQDEIDVGEPTRIGDFLIRVLRFDPNIKGDHGERFFVIHNGGRAVTAGAFCFVLIVLVDFVFALDSIAVLSVSKTFFIVVTSNVLATMALHSLYFVLVDRVFDPRYPQIGVALVLVIIGAKMILQSHVDVPHAVWLALIVGSIGVGVIGALHARGTTE